MAEGMGGGSLWFGRSPSFYLRLARVAIAARPSRIVLAAVGCVLLVGCGTTQLASPEQPPAPAEGSTPVASTTHPPMASPSPSLGEIVWATGADPETNAPRDSVTAFAPDAPRISAFLLANGLPAGSTIDANWEYNDTSLDAFTRQIVVPTQTDQTWVSFHIDRDAAQQWPAGMYEITISLNGETARKAAVEVVSQS